MLKFAPFFLTLSASLMAEPVCHKCEIQREYNKDHPGDYEYFDDYIKAEKCNDKASIETSEASKETKAK